MPQLLDEYGSASFNGEVEGALGVVFVGESVGDGDADLCCGVDVDEGVGVDGDCAGAFGEC